ncbi:MAG: inorganic diphosphatase [Clostridia bacterium]|nr:inorganic diphosphatase [Clostridia bacterium]MBQ8164182.1 inorganic diphosphatase [Clostridia bacterium]
MLGQTVTVIIDRPLGSYHPELPTLYYPINYGYIEGTLAPDGEEEDAYVTGIDKPVSEFTGRVIAVIEREDDVEQKWVVAPENAMFTKEEIAKLTDFQERYFKSKIIMFQ